VKGIKDFLDIALLIQTKWCHSVLWVWCHVAEHTKFQTNMLPPPSSYSSSLTSEERLYCSKVCKKVNKWVTNPSCGLLF